MPRGARFGVEREKCFGGQDCNRGVVEKSNVFFSLQRSRSHKMCELLPCPLGIVLTKSSVTGMNKSLEQDVHPLGCMHGEVLALPRFDSCSPGPSSHFSL